MSDAPVRMILFPGLAADERMYAELTPSTFELVTPRLLVPARNESMACYARRHCELLSIEPGDVVGGCSFGSLLASEICRQIPCRGLILLSGAVSSTQMVAQAKHLNRWGRYLPYFLIRPILSHRVFMERVFGGGSEAELALGLQMFLDAPASLVKEGGRLAVSYFPNEELSVPVFALHGALDRVIRPPVLSGVELVADAGHGMVVSHPQRVANFLEQCAVRLGI
jgi:pimeloyl-ACP methyl ester carboxylesterase